MAKRILFTAFEPFGGLSENSSLLCLGAIMDELAARPLVGLDVTSRVLPVDFAAAKTVVEAEAAKGYDSALHLGQAAGSSAMRLEMFAVNAGVERVAGLEDTWGGPPWGGARRSRVGMFCLCADGPAAYQSTLPLADWAERLTERGVPADVSFHAGTYLCNAVYYWSRYFAEQLGVKTRVAFIHLPLTPQQAADDPQAPPALDVAVTAAGVRMILEELASRSGNASSS